jgi:hypothetical protein
MRRSSRLAAVADRISADAVTFASLPLTLACRVFLALPVDARGRACCVCRAWRDVLADPSLWSRLDMSVLDVSEAARDKGDDWRLFLVALLRGAAGRARGQLRQLDLSQYYVSPTVLLPVLTANADSLRELHLRVVWAALVYDDPMKLTVEAVVAAAPLLQVVTAECVCSTWEVAPRMMRAEPPFALLQLRSALDVDFDGINGTDNFRPFADALADATLQPALSDLCILHAAQPALMGALLDAVPSRRLHELRLLNCTPPVVAPLVRLLAEEGGLLDILNISPTLGAVEQFDMAGAALVADALRVNTTLTELVLSCDPVSADMHATSALLGGLVGHPSLRELRVINNDDSFVEDRSAFGAALGALIAADAPALHVLKCACNAFGDAGLAPIVEALPLNRHLQELDLSWNDMSEDFARHQLLPAVRANTTLRKFKCDTEGRTAARKAVRLVRRRAQQD